MKVIAITGGIGSGKTSVLKMINEEGYNIVSCDKITAELYKKRKVKKAVGKIISGAVKGKLRLKVDKELISKTVFTDKEKLDELNAYFHPLIMKSALKKSKESDISFVEVPLLFESKLEDNFDGVIVILRALNDRIESVKERSNLTEEEIQNRINNQYDYGTIDKEKYYVIENNSGKEELKEKVKEVINKIIN